MLRPGLTVIVLLMTLSHSIPAQVRIQTPDEQLECPALELREEGLAVGDRTLPWAAIRRLSTVDRQVPAHPHRLILADGTALAGFLNEVSDDTVVFRSVAIGLLQLPRESVSAILFDPEMVADSLYPKAESRLVLQDRTQRDGELLYAGRKESSLLDADGVITVATASIRAWLQAKPSDSPAVLRLQNGDSFVAIDAIQRDGLTVTVDGRKHVIPWLWVLDLHIHV
jgi:hypothetical protein